MRINKYIAKATGLGRRKADEAISDGRVLINTMLASTGADVTTADKITLDGQTVVLPTSSTTILLNKPPGYVCSRNGQGNKTVYDLLPTDLHALKTIGRLDKDSSGLLLLTNDGELANKLTHPSHQKNKIYQAKLGRPLQPLHQQMISDHGINLDDGPSKLMLQSLNNTKTSWQITMHEGRNRQIRRTFESLGYEIQNLHRTQFGNYLLGDLKPGDFKNVSAE